MKHPISILFFLILSPWVYGQNTILWEVTNTENNKTSYIVGTFHQFGNSFVDSIPQIKQALLNSELAVFESIDEIEGTREMIQKRGKSLEIEKRLKKKDLEKLKALTRDWKVDLYRLTPLEIRWKLQQEYQKIKCKTVKGTDTFKHFDRYLQHLAEENNIPLVGLETDSLQLALIQKANGDSDWKKERKPIRAWIELLTADKSNTGICELANNYRNFNLDYTFESECEDDVLLLQRNKDWMRIIPKLIRTKNTFLAVGYFHLKYKCGLLEQLKEQGFTVKPVQIQTVSRT